MPDTEAREGLIFDVGMHRGDDTEFYLKKGFRVVAIEANPELVDTARARFAEHLRSGQLVLLNVGIHRHDGVSDFLINESKDDWSSFDARMAGRDGASCRTVEVKTRTFKSILGEFGVPYYLKCDIEGHDELVLQDLLASGKRPAYVSVEAHTVGYLGLLYAAGYREFKLVNQRLNPAIVPPNPPREGRYVQHAFTTFSSGLFGEEVPGVWRSIDEIAYDYLLYRVGFIEKSQMKAGWFDFHARRSEPTLGS